MMKYLNFHKTEITSTSCWVIKFNLHTLFFFKKKKRKKFKSHVKIGKERLIHRKYWHTVYWDLPCVLAYRLVPFPSNQILRISTTVSVTVTVLFHYLSLFFFFCNQTNLYLKYKWIKLFLNYLKINLTKF